MGRACLRLALLVGLAASCGGRAQTGGPKTPQVESAKPPTGNAAANPEQEAPPRDPGLIATPPVPEGYKEMKALLVAPIGDGNAVLLGDDARTVFIPIVIGGTEAVAITFRLNDQEFPRPVTHDLLDHILTKLGGRFTKVQVDKLEDGVFYGSVYLLYKGEILQFDARPSDAIALAVGNDVPIYVARSVIEHAGILRDELEGGDEAPSVMPPAPDTPDTLRPSGEP